MFKPRQYQKEAISIGIDHINNYDDKVPILCIGQGGGKSIVIANLAIELNGTILILQPTRELLEQNYKKYTSYGYEASVFSASLDRKETDKRVIFATIQSVYKHPELFKHIKVIIIDEVHNVDFDSKKSMYNTFLSKIKQPTLGLTATPYRFVTKTKFANSMLTAHRILTMLTEFSKFSEIIYLKEMHELMDEGYLLRPIYHTWDKEFDDKELKQNSTGSDFTEKSIVRYTCSSEKLRKIISAITYCMEKRNKILVYASCIEQARLIERELKRLGIKVGSVDSNTSDEERKSLVDNFKENKRAILINVLCFKEGFDCESTDCIVYCRPTMSALLYSQIAGRLTRLDPNNPNKQPVFCDCTNTYKTIGKAEDLRLLKDSNGKLQLFNITTKKQLTDKLVYSYVIRDMRKKK